MSALQVVQASLHRRHATLRFGPFSLRFERRAAVIYLILVAAAVVAAIVGIGIGDYTMGPGQILAALQGTAEDPLAQYFVTQVRLPRAVTALLVGMALGMSGAIFQTVSGNPLGSPDVIGFTTGAATGALVQIILLGGDTLAIALASVAGGLATAAVVYSLSWRSGVAGFRLVLVGIGVGAVLAAVNSLLVVKAPLEAAQTATQWLAGSLNSTLWPEAAIVAIALAVLTPVAVSLVRPLAQLPLGDAAATGLGVRVERSRLVLIIIGVALMGVATASTGPIAFIALAAPHLVRRLTHTPGAPLFGAGLMGAVLVLVSDLIAHSDAFAARWARHGVVLHRTDRKVFRNSLVGDIHLIGDVLEVPGEHLSVVTFTPAPDGLAADRLARLAERSRSADDVPGDDSSAEPS